MTRFAYLTSTQDWLILLLLIGLFVLVPFVVLFVALVRFLWLRAKQ